jgi:hypothetical protein
LLLYGERKNGNVIEKYLGIRTRKDYLQICFQLELITLLVLMPLSQ